MQLLTHPTFLKLPKEERVRQVADYICRKEGLKAVLISHLSEKLAGHREFTRDDLYELQGLIPDDLPWLWEWWVAALTGHSFISVSRLAVSGRSSASLSADRRPPPSSPAMLQLCPKEAA